MFRLHHSPAGVICALLSFESPNRDRGSVNAHPCAHLWIFWIPPWTIPLTSKDPSSAIRRRLLRHLWPQIGFHEPPALLQDCLPLKESYLLGDFYYFFIFLITICADSFESYAWHISVDLVINSLHGLSSHIRPAERLLSPAELRRCRRTQRCWRWCSWGTGCCLSPRPRTVRTQIWRKCHCCSKWLVGGVTGC